MAFYLPQNERQQMEMNVVNAVDKAFAFLNQNKQR
jgi:hypothetical protein